MTYENWDVPTPYLPAGVCDCSECGSVEVSSDGCEICHHPGVEISQRAMRSRLPRTRRAAAGPGFRFCTTKWCPIIYFNNKTGVYFAQDDVLPGTPHKSDHAPRRK